MAWLHVISPIMTYFRQRRLTELLKMYPNLANYSVLDVGGRPFIWNLLKEHYQVVPQRLILLNNANEIAAVKSSSCEFDYETQVADGCNLPYEDDSFDLVFSNSVIEHVGTYSQMAQFASECSRVGKQIYIQTPNRWFPLEAHFGAAFVHWLPKPWYRRLSCLSVRHLFTYNDPEEKVHFKRSLDTTNLLSKQQLRSLFPQKKIVAERVLGMAKSFIVISSVEA